VLKKLRSKKSNSLHELSDTNSSFLLREVSSRCEVFSRPNGVSYRSW